MILKDKKMSKKLGMILLSTIIVSACSPTVTIVQNPEVLLLEKAGIKDNSIYEAKVSDKAGASIYFTLNEPNKGGSGYQLKATQDGIAPKTAADIDHFVIYLIKNSASSSYPLNGDPLGTSDLVGGPFEVSYGGSGS